MRSINADPLLRAFGNRRTNRRGFLWLAASSAGLLAAPTLLGGCGKPSAPTVASPTVGTAASTGAPQGGGTLKVVYQGEAKQLDPARYLTIEDGNFHEAVYNRLVRQDAKLAVRPDLATSWQASDDLKTWTFKLREGVTFHHGKVFNADDVVYTFKRIFDPATASAGRSILSFIDGVEKQDDTTVTFRLKTPHAELPQVLGGPYEFIVPSDRSDEQIQHDPSGTGPFKYGKKVVGEYLSVVRNENYWEAGLPYLDEIHQVTQGEQATRTAMLTGGQIDMIWQIEPEVAAALETAGSVVIHTAQSGGFVPLVMRADRPPFDDLRVRQAMKSVIDREQMLQAAMMGRGDLANDQPIAPIQPLYTDIGLRKRDVEKARQLLAEAGHPQGLDLTLYTTPGRPGMVEQALAFQQMAEPAGIRVQIQRVPVDVYWADYWLKKDFTVSNWYLRSTIDETLSTTFLSDAKWNEAYYKNPALDDLILSARSERDEVRRKETYAKAARLISDEGGSIIAFFRPVMSAARTVVQGFEASPLGRFDPRGVWVKREG